MKNENNPKPFQLPDAILAQLNEFSNGGYILVRMGEGENPPEIFLQSDNPIISIGLIEYLRCWCNSLQSVNETSITETMMGQIGDDDDDEEENDEE